MKITIVTNVFPQYSEKFTFDRIIGLIKNGFDVRIYCTKKGDFSFYKDDIEKYNLKNKIRIYPGYNLFNLLKSPIKVSKILFKELKTNGLNKNLLHKVKFMSAFLREKHDVIHFEFGLIGKELIFLKNLFHKTKFATSFRGFGLYYIKNKNYTQLFQRCDHFHFIAKYLLNQAKKLNYNKNNYIIINPSIDINLYEKRTKQNNKIPIIISVGRLHWRKGYPYALEALKILKEKGYNFKYKILGSGEQEEVIKYQIIDSNLENNVELLGSIPREQVKEELQNADLFLHTAVCEGFCNAVLEAQAMQLPVVTSNVGGLPENIKDKETGFLINPRDPEETANCLIKLIENKKLREQLGKKGRERVKTFFNLEKQNKEFKKMYEEIR